jgi:hypothetical protein
VSPPAPQQSPGAAGGPVALPGVQGSVVWALVPYDFRQPFAVTDHSSERPRSYANITDLAQAVQAREVGPELRIELDAKIRPVLLLQDRPAKRLREFAALKLSRLEKLAPADRDAVRDQKSARFFHLPDPGRFGLGKQFAIDVLSLVRVHETAIVGPPQGKLNTDEFRVVCERLARVMDLDIANLVVREAAAFLKRQNLA